MTIYLYSGTPGSGKSLHQAMDVWYHLKYGRPCVCNYLVNTDAIGKTRGEFLYLENDELTPDALYSFASAYWKDHKFKEGTIKVYIDECQLLFNSRETLTDKNRKAWIKFFSQHRKYGMDVFLVAQFDRMIDRQIRSLIEYEYVHRKVSNIGWKGKLFSMFALGQMYVSVKIWYPMKEKVGSEFLVPKRRYFKIYDSYKMFEDTHTTKDLDTDTTE